MWAQGDDLSVVTDSDETGSRVIEYGKNRKIVLPAPLKGEIKEIGSRELRRRGLGQHTLEKALHEHVRVNTYRRIVAAIEESEKEKQACAHARSKKHCEASPIVAENDAFGPGSHQARPNALAE